jgi:hypothetical protein
MEPALNKEGATSGTAVAAAAANVQEWQESQMARTAAADASAVQ